MSLQTPPPANQPSAGFMAIAPFFLSSFAWNFTLGMTFILIPLYARSLGMSGVLIGALVAVPVVLQICFSLLGGALTDRVGGKNMAMISCVLTCVSGGIFMVSAGFGMMLLAQLVMVTSRAMFWPATWALASQLPGNTSTQMGRLNVATNCGQIAGTAAAGFLIAMSDFRVGFGAMTAVAFVALVLNQMFRTASAPRGHAPANSILGTYRILLGQRTMRYGIMCSYISALPLSLCFSFYPILLVEQGFDSDTTGTFISLRGVGAVAIGFVAGYLVKQVRSIRTPVTSAIVVGVSVACAAAVTQPALIAFFLFALGAGSALMTVYFQLLISQISSKETRGSAMALAGMGWSISHLTTPVAMGIFQDYVNIHFAFYAMGTFALLCGFALIPAQRWAFDGKPVKAV